MKLIGIPHQLPHFPHCCLGELEQLRRPVHPVVNKELLRRLIQLVAENLTQITAVPVR